MKNFFLVLVFIFIAIHAICQDKQIKVNLWFNNYMVCDLSDNFEMYFFYIDTDDCYKIDKALTTGRSINTNLDLKNYNNLLYFIFKYKNYTLILDCSNFFKDYFEEDTKLDFKIEKRNCYKKYIRKSYSKSYKNGKKKLNDWEFDVSCNGLCDFNDGTPKIDVFNKEYRRLLNQRFKEKYRDEYKNRYRDGYRRRYNFIVKISSNINKLDNCYGYKKNHKKTFIQNELLFKELLLMDGMQATKNIKNE